MMMGINGTSSLWMESAKSSVVVHVASPIKYRGLVDAQGSEYRYCVRLGVIIGNVLMYGGLAYIIYHFYQPMDHHAPRMEL